jgi:hypothetical protein
VKTVELAQDATRTAGPDADSHGELLAALSGNQAGRERAVAYRTRRVVMASFGVMQDQKAGRKRGLALAMAAILLLILVLGPFLWRVADDLIDGEFFSDIPTQFSLWVCILCAALLAAALVAGWARKKH